MLQKTILSIQLTKAGNTGELMRNFIDSRGLIMLSQYGIVKVLRVEAYALNTIRLVGVC